LSFSIRLLTNTEGNVCGNKDYKLKFNIAQAIIKGHQTLLTFGGAYSNHIQATAILGEAQGFNTIGVIRGEELGINLEQTLQQNPTLQQAHKRGMHFKFISRSDYRLKHTQEFLDKLKQEFPNAYIIPEGGTNTLAVKGCEDILIEEDFNYDYICCPVGTGGTIAGIINASKTHQMVLGFPALKGDFLSAEIQKYTTKSNWKLITDFHFRGYAKINLELIQFINTYKKEQGIQLVHTVLIHILFHSIFQSELSQTLVF